MHTDVSARRHAPGAAYAAGYPDTFTMSNAFRRITGLRPSQLCDVDQNGVLDL